MEDDKYFQKIHINNNVLAELGEYEIPCILLDLMNNIIEKHNIEIDKEHYIAEYLNDKYISDEKKRVINYKKNEKQRLIELKRKERKKKHAKEILIK